MASQTKHIITGSSGEESAVAYLAEKGYQIRCRNFRHKRAEVDIIAQKDDVLVFVEVKTRTSDSFGYPEEAVSPKKEALLIAAAEEYIHQTDWQHDIRFDIISITLSKPPVIYHIEDAFH
ncbi:YraN family protein [Pontibacter beigongshangensis]|uniref:YraN family protein n=1 Tax=Pontibacter beigongshangensis TaxID=2574733 RepID=UPI0016507BAA|nr:YraN family protein [Pontibacter beigongshangensis]